MKKYINLQEELDAVKLELRELKDRIVNVEHIYNVDHRMMDTFSSAGKDLMEQDMRYEAVHALAHKIYKLDLYMEGRRRKAIPSVAGSYEVIEFKHLIQVVLPPKPKDVK